MSQLQRTGYDYTAGIVNIPQNVPAQLFFKSDNPTDIAKFEAILRYYGITYHAEIKRKFTTIKSDNQIERPIVDLIRKANPKFEIKRLTTMRYPFFELDVQDMDQHQQVLDAYQQFAYPVYWHFTMRGIHYLSAKPVPTDKHAEFISSIKDLNPACPMITLRIKANKWINEWQAWQTDGYQAPLHTDTIQLGKMIRERNVDLIKTKYLVVHYRQTGELANL